MNAAIWIVCPLVATACVAALLGGTMTRISMRRRFTSRPQCSSRDILMRLGPSASCITSIWVRLEHVLQVPEGRLRLDDRFGVELAPPPCWAVHNPAAEILEDIEKHWPSTAATISSVRDFCEFAISQIQNGLPEQELIRKVL